MRYKIIITELGEERKIIPREWVAGAADVTEKRPSGMGYAPEVETLVEVERKVLEQNVSDLDLIAVIKAVNNIETEISLGQKLTGRN